MEKGSNNVLLLTNMACMDADDEEDESMLYMVMVIMSWSCMGINVVPPVMLTSLGSDESLSFGDDKDVEILFFFNLFFNAEFQKFFISLSVRPGRRAAICDHLN